MWSCFEAVNSDGNFGGERKLRSFFWKTLWHFLGLFKLFLVQFCWKSKKFKILLQFLNFCLTFNFLASFFEVFSLIFISYVHLKTFHYNHPHPAKYQSPTFFFMSRNNKSLPFHHSTRHKTQKRHLFLYLFSCTSAFLCFHLLFSHLASLTDCKSTSKRAHRHKFIMEITFWFTL